jgi:hypothetical protein
MDGMENVKIDFYLTSVGILHWNNDTIELSLHLSIHLTGNTKNSRLAF